MNKIIYIFFVVILLGIKAFSGDVEIIKRVLQKEIDPAKINAVDFESKDAVYNFIKEILPEEFKTGNKNWMERKLKRSVIILLKHKFNSENLSLKNALTVRETKIKELNAFIEILEKELATLRSSKMEKEEILDRRELKTEIGRLKRERYKLVNWFFEWEEKIDSYVLHKEGEEWSSRLFGTGRILIVLLGGRGDLAKADLSVKEKRSLVKKSLGVPVRETGDKESPAPPPGTFFCRFVEINPKVIDPPCILSVAFNAPGEEKKVFSYPIIKKNIVLFRVGVAASNLRKINIFLEGENIVAESAEENGFKLEKNLFFMLDFHLPRDMKQYRPPIAPWKGFKNRLGIFAGLKLSSDPLNAIFMGLSYSLTRDISLVSGFAFYNEIKPSVTYIGVISSLSDATTYLFRSYSSPKFFWGLSMSPALIPKILGISF